MRGSRVAVVAALACVLAAGTAAAAAGEVEAAYPFARQEEVVAFVLDQGPRFADARDYEVRRGIAVANFDTLGEVLGTSYYRVLPTQAVWYAPLMDFGDGGSALVEMVLVEGCAVPEDDSELLTPDRSRYEGDPDLMASG